MSQMHSHTHTHTHAYTHTHMHMHTHTHARTHTHTHTTPHHYAYVGIHVFDALTGREIHDSGAFRHQLDVVSLALSHAGLSNQRLLAFIDKNHDLYVTSVRGPHAFNAIRIGMCEIVFVKFNDYIT